MQADAIPAAAPLPATPGALYGALFVDVQTSGLFADGKTFADARLRGSSAEFVCALCARLAQQLDFSLADFVADHFFVCAAPLNEPAAAGAPRLLLREHIRALWPSLVRESAATPGEAGLLCGGGLRDHGHERMAGTVASRWLGLVKRVYDQTGRLLEKHDFCGKRPSGGGEYPTQDGFGWASGVVGALTAIELTLLARGSR